MADAPTPNPSAAGLIDDDQHPECSWCNGAAFKFLRGHDLACFCPLEDQYGNRVPCHADVLIELANEPTRETP